MGKQQGVDMGTPVLELYVLWHPDDARAADIAEAIFAHHHRAAFHGAIGGAVEVYFRSTGFRGHVDAPRPVPLPGHGDPHAAAAAFVALVPILGNELAQAARDASGSWFAYLQDLVTQQRQHSERIALFPYQLDDQALGHTALDGLFGQVQRVGAADPTADRGADRDDLLRDLSQGLAQWLKSPGRSDRVTVFVSHTKHKPEPMDAREDLIPAVRQVIGATRLLAFYDAQDPQPGEDWAATLRARAADSAVLALRSDVYATRDWCHREVHIAKTNGMPLVMLDAPEHPEPRGSFLLDHMPRVPVRRVNGQWCRTAIRRAVNLLVDECLKRELWRHQERLASHGTLAEVVWWAPQAPEPVTLTAWWRATGQPRRAAWPRMSSPLTAWWRAARKNRVSPDALVVLHPDPPMSAEEQSALNAHMQAMGNGMRLDLLTPRTLAARTGHADPV